MFFGQIGKRPEVNQPMDGSGANQADSANAAAYPYLSIHRASFSSTDSEFGEQNMVRQGGGTIEGIRTNYIDADAVTEINSGGWIAMWERIMNVTFGSSGNNSGTGNYHQYTGGGYYHGGGQISSFGGNSFILGHGQEAYPTRFSNWVSQPNGVFPVLNAWHSMGASQKLGEIRGAYDDVAYDTITQSGVTQVHVNSAWSYGGWGPIGNGGTNPAFMGQARHKMCLLWLQYIPRATFLTLHKNKGRIKI